MLKSWQDLPEFMKIPEVRNYWEALNRKRAQILFKRALDYFLASILLLLLLLPMLLISIAIKISSPGPLLFRQERVTTYGKRFRIHKFRTMVINAEQIGSAVTSDNDTRITKIGKILRDFRLDEIPQLFDILSGNMSFVGTRPEAVSYVKLYKPEYFATLLLPAGITSEASIAYKNEALLLTADGDIEDQYVNSVLPEKMRINLEALKNFSLADDISVMFKTVFAVLKRDSD
ncbi:MAG: sugar transferase [Clostridia bacterium]|nr:sugar transferase [Clostridia bacterium]